MSSTSTAYTAIISNASAGEITISLTDSQTTSLEAGRYVYDVLITASGGTKTRVCLLYTSPSPRDATLSRMPSSA